MIADLHIHSRYSQATSQQMNIAEIAKYGKIKGLQLIGTGDFTHPKWLEEIKQTLIPDGATGLFKLKEKTQLPVWFMLTTEVATFFNYENKSRKIHHVIFTPTLDHATQINEKLAKHGNLSSDGRPALNFSAPQLVEEVMQISRDNLIFPAHIWTPWFGALGALSGFDTIEDCYQDTLKHIHALETGISSNPLMNWRLSKHDKFTLLSNSDSHSFWPWRLGREANVFELEYPTYQEIINAILTKDTKRFKFTIETDSAYGRYHWTGHRNCNISLPPKEATKLGNICPVCGKKLTEGVEQRIEKLADRPINAKDPYSPGFKQLLPLSEIIAAVLNVESPSTKTVWNKYNQLIEKFGDEYAVLLDISKEDLIKVIDPPIGDAIIKAREGNIKIIPGFDGVYGKLVLETPNNQIKPELQSEYKKQSNLTDFW
ncbi:MAG: DNA helicase UvrD [Crenarchaeota archaeon]|nr:DNA helicase UvrD [Thermoproteota archaeon]